MNPFFRKSLSTTIAGAVTEAQAASEMDHLYLRGKLREIALRGIIDPWLTDTFGTGTGKITDCNGAISDEVDLLIFAKDVMPPIIYSDDGFGLYPCEACLATIEVKSHLNAEGLQSALDSSARISADHMEFQSGRWNQTGTRTVPHGFVETVRCLFAFSSDLKKPQDELRRYRRYADPTHHKRLDMFCIVGHGYWVDEQLDNGTRQWSTVPPSPDFDEVIAFSSVLCSGLHRIYRDRGRPPLKRYFGHQQPTQLPRQNDA